LSQASDRFPYGFEWDEAKNQSNIRKHGIDFRDAVKVFDKPTLDRQDLRQDYSEVRVNSIGDLDGLIPAILSGPPARVSLGDLGFDVGRWF